MSASTESLAVVRKVEVGKILLSKDGDDDSIDPKFLQWIQASVSAKHFKQIFSLEGGKYTLWKCGTGQATHHDNVECLTLHAEISSFNEGNSTAVADLEDVVLAIQNWIGKAISTLLENASSSTEDDVQVPSRIDLSFVSSADFSAQIVN